MKIAVVCERFRNSGSGHDRAVFDAVDFLRTAHEVTVFAARVDRSCRFLNVVFVRIPAVPVYRFMIQTTTFRLFWFLFRVSGALRGYNAVLSSSVIFGGSDVAMVQFHSCRWLRELMRLSADSFHNRLRLAYFRAVHSIAARFERRAYGRIARAGRPFLLPVSADLRDGIIKFHDVPQRYIAVLHNPVDINIFYPAKDRVDAPTGLHAVFVGSGWERKGLGDAIAALSIAGCRVRLSVVGQGNEIEYRDLAQRLGVAERVQFLGFRGDVAPLLRSADVFVLPSRFEGLPVACLEALASGLPLLIYDFPGARELIGETDCGAIVSDKEALGDELSRLAMDSALLNSMRAAARNQSLKFSKQPYGEALESILLQRQRNMPD